MLSQYTIYLLLHICWKIFIIYYRDIKDFLIAIIYYRKFMFIIWMNTSLIKKESSIYHNNKIAINDELNNVKDQQENYLYAMLITNLLISRYSAEPNVLVVVKSSLRFRSRFFSFIHDATRSQRQSRRLFA